MNHPEGFGGSHRRVDGAVHVGQPAALDCGPMTAWSFDAGRLSAMAAESGPWYRSAQPFPHVVLDGVFPDALVGEIAAQFPSPDDDGWLPLAYEFQQKLQWTDAGVTPAVIDAFIGMMHSSRFLGFLEELTGVPGLVGDPHLFHGGPHQSEPGGFLNVHTDQLFQPRLWLYRRVNVIVYLNREWDPAWGGHLEFWDDAMTTCVRQIEPAFNRMVIFDTSPSVYHGHPEPMASPSGVTRQSIALYYYTSPENPATPPTGHGSSHFVDIKPRWRRWLIAITPPLITRRLDRLFTRAR